MICGLRIEQIEDPLMQKIRYLDKLIDELAKGRPMKKSFARLKLFPVSFGDYFNLVSNHFDSGVFVNCIRVVA